MVADDKISFDFLAEGQFVRTTLDVYVEQNGISTVSMSLSQLIYNMKHMKKTVMKT